MDAKPGTLSGDRLEVLTTLVERYESQHEPIKPPNPIDALLISPLDWARVVPPRRAGCRLRPPQT
jgi:antitoxin component HigA of HigAB toxin-antitoxin module